MTRLRLLGSIPAPLLLTSLFALTACSEDTTDSGPVGGSGGAAGTSGGSAGEGGAMAGGGTSGAAGTMSEAGTTSAGGTGGSAMGMAGGDAGMGDPPVAAGFPCPRAGADEPFQLYAFDFDAAGNPELGEWSTFNMGPLVGSMDDSDPSNATPGSLQATITYTDYGTFPVLEAYYDTPLDVSCYETFSVAVKIASPVDQIPFITLYVTAGANPPGAGYFSGNLLETDGIGDGEWHVLTGTLQGNTAAIQRIGFQMFPATTAPDAGPAIPPPVDILIDDFVLQ